MIHRPRTLLWRLGLGLMAVQAAAVLLLGWYSAVMFRQYNHDQTVAELQRLMPFLMHRYGELNDRGAGAAELDRVVKDDALLTSVRVTLIAADGTVLADSERQPATMDNHLHRPEVQAAIKGEPAPNLRESATTGEQTIYLAQVNRANGGPMMIVRGSLPLSAISDLPAHVARVIGAAALLSLLLTFIVIYFVSRRLSGSVQRLADGAARFAAGDLSHRIERPHSREMAALVESLNDMAVRLGEQIDLLQAQRSEQQAIHQSMSNGLIALDPEQRILSVNRAAERLLSLDGAEVRGRLMQEVLREPELHRFVAGAMSGDGPPSVAELQLRQAEGPRIQAVSQPLRSAPDQPPGLLVLMTDVTELRRLETVRTDFAANVSHELRTPITNIKGYVETMLDIGVGDEQRTRRFLEIINRNTHRLASIIEDLLALARLEQPDTRAMLDKQDVSALRVVEAAVGQLEGEIDAKNTRIVVRVPGPLKVRANVQLLEQALANLISNAVRYSPAGTTVTIGGEQALSGEVRLSVADEGPGIPEEHLTRIFERFYRIDRARSREMGGTGLGLSIVKHIALVHRGNVTVESEVGKGSTFTIVLPGRGG